MEVFVMGKKEVELNSELTLEKAVEYLESILAGLKKGKVFIQQDDEVVELTPNKTVAIEVEAKQKKHGEKLSFKLSWKKECTEKTEKEEKEIFRITSTQPDVKTEK
jgi:amphi-Trp domain-containing protein